jgi:hypothetical protein
MAQSTDHGLTVLITWIVCYKRQDKTRKTTTRQDKTRNDKKRHDTTRHDTTRQGKARHEKTRHDKTRQGKTRQDKTRQDKTIRRHDKTSIYKASQETMTRHDKSQRQDKTTALLQDRDKTKKRSPEGPRCDEAESESDLAVEEVDFSEADEAKKLSLKGSRRLKWTNPSFISSSLFWTFISSSLFWGVLVWLSREFVPSTSDDRGLNGQKRKLDSQKRCLVFVLALVLVLPCLAFHLFSQLSCLVFTRFGLVFFSYRLACW